MSKNYISLGESIELGQLLKGVVDAVVETEFTLGDIEVFNSSGYQIAKIVYGSNGYGYESACEKED